MIQFLNNMIKSLTQENPELLKYLLIPSSIIENYIFKMLF